MKKKSAKTSSQKPVSRSKKAVRKPLSKPASARKKNSSLKKKISSRKTVKALAGKKLKKVSSSPQDLRDLPFSYNKTRLALLVRDPYWGYVYWDFSEKTWNWIQDFFRKDPGTQVKLRVHNLTDRTFMDVDVQLEAQSWYLCFGLDNREFETELGLMDSKGRFHSIVKSNRMRTPRSQPSEKIDPNWDPANFDELYRLSGGGQAGGTSAFFSYVTKKHT